MCGRTKADPQFLAGKAKKPSSACATCRRKAAASHRRAYYASLPPDKRHELTHRRRAEGYGVAHVAYSRTAIMVRWDYRCAYCNAPATHMDHVVPLSKGGSDVEHNCLPACQRCNLTKGALTLADWALADPSIKEIDVPPPF